LREQHTVVRFQRWAYTGIDGDNSAITLLKKAYETFSESAEKTKGAGAIWLLIQPED
jgi:hypothetical protein